MSLLSAQIAGLTATTPTPRPKQHQPRTDALTRNQRRKLVLAAFAQFSRLDTREAVSEAGGNTHCVSRCLDSMKAAGLVRKVGVRKYDATHVNVWELTTTGREIGR